VSLVGRVIASHYAEPIERRVAQDVVLRAAPSDDGEAIRKLAAGELFELLDDSLGWSWGYAGKDRHVGYVRSDAVG
jgi:hypothetical protein